MGAAHISRSAALGATGNFIAEIGRTTFWTEFSRGCCNLFGAEQITAFAVDEDRSVRTLLAYRRMDRGNAADSLCRSYAARFLRRDALLRSYIEADESDTVKCVFARSIEDALYGWLMFLDVGLAGKISFLRKFGNEHVYLNFYFSDERPIVNLEIDEDLRQISSLWTGCIWRHDELTGGRLKSSMSRAKTLRIVIDRLPDLSMREAQVCTGILCGFSLEATSLEYGFAISTAATFRKRAYRKLGITSQRELAAFFVST